MSIMSSSQYEDQLSISAEHSSNILLDTTQITALDTITLQDWANNHGWSNLTITNSAISGMSQHVIQPLSGITSHTNTLWVDDLYEQPVKRRYVVAGNFSEYNNFLKHKGYDSNVYVFVNSADSLRGLKDIHGYYIGSWRARKDIESIKLNIELANLV